MAGQDETVGDDIGRVISRHSSTIWTTSRQFQRDYEQLTIDKEAKFDIIGDQQAAFSKRLRFP
jgi:hypothetical protein